ncbi:MAG: hypothetical protein ABSB79_06690 [Syntrophales bacterium]
MAKPSYILLSVLFCITVVFFSGCASIKTPSNVPAFYSSPDAAWRALLASHPEGPTLKVYARFDIRFGSERYPLRAAMVIHPPSDLRMEILPMIGPPESHPWKMPFRCLPGYRLLALRISGYPEEWMDYYTAWIVSLPREKFNHYGLSRSPVISIALCYLMKWA